MTDAELTEMLRSSANRVVNYAGDRIEQLTAENAKLRDALSKSRLAFARYVSAQSAPSLSERKSHE